MPEYKQTIERNRRLVLMEERLQKAKESLWQAAEEIQSRCSHPVVFQHSGAGACHRICKVCGYEEDGTSRYPMTSSQWLLHDFTQGYLGPSDQRVIREDQNDFFKARIEGFYWYTERKQKQQEKAEELGA